jgi:hypothetical protein
MLGLRLGNPTHLEAHLPPQVAGRSIRRAPHPRGPRLQWRWIRPLPPAAALRHSARAGHTMLERITESDIDGTRAATQAILTAWVAFVVGWEATPRLLRTE